MLQNFVGFGTFYTDPNPDLKMPRLCNVKTKNKFAKLSKMEKDLCINGDI